MPGVVATASTTANVVVGSSITLTGLAPSFTLSGNPGDTDNTTVPTVTMQVTTNNNEGYVVAVQAATPALNPTRVGNTDTIPVESLQVREGGTTAYSSLASTGPVVVHTQAGPSAPEGDVITNDFRITLPFVTPDTYSAVLDYAVATL